MGIPMGELIKTERVLEGNLSNLFAVLMSLCDSHTRNQVESTTRFQEVEKKLVVNKILLYTKLALPKRQS